MKQLRKQADEFVFMTTTIGPRAILVFLVIVVGLLRMCIPDKTDPMDNSINKSSEIVAMSWSGTVRTMASGWYMQQPNL